MSLLGLDFEKLNKGILTDSCEGKLTLNVFFGEIDIGKTTVASLTSSMPGLFEVPKNTTEQNTIGTWLSSSISADEYCFFANTRFQPVQEIETIPSLPDIGFCPNMTGNFAFLDTDILDFQLTEMAENYDFVTILPHALIAENVFFVVKDRLNPDKLIKFVEKLAMFAQKTEGTFTFRNGKLFGNLIIIVTECKVKGK